MDYDIWAKECIIPMKNTSLIILIVILVLIVGSFVFREQEENDKNKLDNLEVTGEIQKINLSFKNYNYYPKILKVKQSAVELTLDYSVTGCYRSFTIKDLGVSKYSKNPEDKIFFTPNKRGTFKFSCAMGMGYGTIIVE